MKEFVNVFKKMQATLFLFYVILCFCVEKKNPS